MPSGKASSVTNAKASGKPKGAKTMLLERTGVLWAIDKDGGLQILNGEESVATAVDYYGLYWNAKLGPKKVNGKSAPVHTRSTQHVMFARAFCVCFTCVHTLACVRYRLFDVCGWTR